MVRPLAVLVGLSLLAPLAGAGIRPRGPLELPWLTSVIVRATAGTVTGVEQQVAALGGSVRRQLDLIHGFSADVPIDKLGRLASVPGVQAVSHDGPVRLLATGPVDPATPSRATSMAAVTAITGAREMWDAGYTGAGVDVAVIDSGVAPVAGLDGGGKLINGADFSADAESAAARPDGYGHGTHMAGIIAGRDTAAHDRSVADVTGGTGAGFLGMAPDARIVDVKVADAAGNTDVSKLIAGIDWVVTHAHRDGLDIRVLNLSFGVQADQGYETDPLAFAAEAAWHSGVVVVAAAGNAGSLVDTTALGLTDPAYDPYLLAVGAADTNGTVDRKDDSVADFSSRAAAGGDRRPDVVAPGRSVQSLLAPGSQVDLSTTPGNNARRFVNGSGTSQASAVVSGAAALVVAQWPAASPDQVKAVLADSAKKVTGADDNAQGHGEIDLGKALRIKELPMVRQQWPPSDGSGEQAVGSPTAGDGGFTKAARKLKGKAAKDAKEAAKRAAKRAKRAEKGGPAPVPSAESPDGAPIIDDGFGHSWSGHSWSGHSWSGHSWSSAGWSDGDWG